MGRFLSLEELLPIRNTLHREGKRVVFTNGCFDLLHRGHVEFLNRARGFGDVLVVGLNSNESMRRIKGKRRPIVSEEDRAFIISNLAAVDYVSLFEEDTPLKMITALLPDVLVKGADWGVGEIVGKEVVEAAGGLVANIPLVPNRSTTDIVKKIVKDFSGSE
ncbi:MAG: D-glycero-beta-D-manno-heptose 1-phosphate adenylyltransferase [Bacteroidota bacterium]